MGWSLCNPSSYDTNLTMKFQPTIIDGVLLIDLERHEDERGFFARSYCEQEFYNQVIHDKFTQMNISYNTATGTLRGMHYQSLSAPESKIIRCLKGSIYDVAVDLRPESKTFKQWIGIYLDDDKRNSVYIASGIAHGFITLVPNCELLYMMGGEYTPSAAQGVRWNDPAFNIHWPIQPNVISQRDCNYNDFITI